MSQLSILPVTTWRQRSQFLQLPWQINRQDPNWIPPLRMNQKELVGYKHHPFYARNKIQTFLALRDGRPCGRLAAIINYAHIERYQDPRGFIGFFESIDDVEVSRGLFDAARQWFAEHQLVDFRGPINPSLNYECGLLIDGFDTPPYFMMTHNLPYYARLFEDYGFRKVQDMFSFWGRAEMIQQLDKKLYFVRDEAIRRFQIKVRRMDRSRFRDEVLMFLNLYNQSLGGTWGFTPLSDAEIDHMAASLRHLIVPDLTSVLEVEGRPVAGAFTLLNYNPRIRKIDGRLFPFGFAYLLWNRRKIKQIRMISTNVLPEFQRWGLGLVLMAELVAPVLEWGIEEAEFSWVLESNHLSYKTLQRGGAKITKQYRIYDYGPNPDRQLPSQLR